MSILEHEKESYREEEKVKITCKQYANYEQILICRNATWIGKQARCGKMIFMLICIFKLSLISIRNRGERRFNWRGDFKREGF